MPVEAPNKEKEVAKTPEQVAAEKKEAEKAKAPLTNPGIDFLKRSLGKKEAEPDPAKKKADDAAAAKTKTDKEAKDAKAKADKDAAEKKKKAAAAAKPAAAPAVDVGKIATDAATAAATAAVETMEARRKKAEPKEVDPFDVPEHKEVLGKLRLLEDAHGDKYKGVQARYKKSVQDWEKYAQKWEKEHEGQEFDQDAEEHRAIRNKLEAAWDYNPDDYVEALADKKADERVGKRLDKELAPIKARQDEIDRRDRAQAEKPKIEAAGKSAANRLVKQLGDEFTDILNDKGEIDDAKLAALAESEPIVHDEIVGVTSLLKHDSAILYRLFNDLDVLDTRNNDHHRRIYEMNRQFEQEMLTQPDDVRTDGQGRKFATAAAYHEMSDAQKEKHWVFNDRDLTFILTGKLAAKARALIEKEEEKFAKYAKSKGVTHTPRTKKSTEATTTEHEEDTVVVDEKPESPSTTGVTRTAAARGGSGGGAKTAQETFWNRSLGKS